MSALFIIVGVMGAIFFGIQFLAMIQQRSIKKYPYRALKKYKSFEIRAYAPAIFTSVELSSNSYNTASSNGFRILAGYIFGNNERRQKIAMTSPVAMNLGEKTNMSFMVPNHLKMQELPRPNHGRIEFKEEPSKTVAAIKFGGWANDEKLKFYKKKLEEALEEEGISHNSKFQYLGYNAPYEMFFRKNEVIVELL